MSENGPVKQGELLRFVERLFQKEGDINITEVCYFGEQNVSTLHRIVSILINGGYMNQEEKRSESCLGLRALGFSKSICRRLIVRDVGFPSMQQLGKLAQEDISLSILDKNEAVCIELIKAPHNLRTPVELGSRVPLHCTVVGKIFLAHMGNEIRERLLITKGLPRYTQNTIIDRVELEKELIIVKEKGIAIDNEEMEIGVRCVASAVKDYAGDVVAAVNISVPTTRLGNRRMQRLTHLMKECALEISNGLPKK